MTTIKKTTKIYYPNGRVFVREWEDGTRPSYEWLRDAVDGYIEPVGQYLPDGGPGGREQAWCNEEGRLNGLRVNIHGMKAINWPEPPGGWDSLSPETPAGPPPSPIVLHAGMAPHELIRARTRMLEWQPVVGPIVVMHGWLEEDYDDEEPLTPVGLGEEML